MQWPVRAGFRAVEGAIGEEIITAVLDLFVQETCTQNILNYNNVNPGRSSLIVPLLSVVTVLTLETTI